MASISELSVGKILTVYHHGIEAEAFFVLYTKYLVTQNIWCVAHSAICVLQGLRKRKMNKVTKDGKYIASCPSAAFFKSIMN